jgi:hypothetical protein
MLGVVGLIEWPPEASTSKPPNVNTPNELWPHLEDHSIAGNCFETDEDDLVDRDVENRPFDTGARAVEMPPLTGVRRESTGAHGRA